MYYPARSERLRLLAGLNEERTLPLLQFQSTIGNLPATAGQ
jgi:hypothetical protein